MKCKNECPRNLCDCCYHCSLQLECDYCCVVPIAELSKAGFPSLDLTRGEGYKVKNTTQFNDISCENDLENTANEYDYKKFNF